MTDPISGREFVEALRAFSVADLEALRVGAINELADLDATAREEAGRIVERVTLSSDVASRVQYWRAHAFTAAAIQAERAETERAIADELSPISIVGVETPGEDA